MLNGSDAVHTNLEDCLACLVNIRLLHAQVVLSQNDEAVVDQVRKIVRKYLEKFFLFLLKEGLFVLDELVDDGRKQRQRVGQILFVVLGLAADLNQFV